MSLYIYPNLCNIQHQELNPKINCGLWEAMMWQCRYIKGTKCIILVGDADNLGGCTCVGTEGTWKISVPSFPFCREPKSALKKLKS